MTHRSKPRTDALRDIPLERVAIALGYRRDTRDRARWKRPGSILSINGTKFYDHLAATGGGGAIDLVLHASNCSFLQALDTLAGIEPPPRDGNPFRKRLDAARWPAVRQHLARHRSLDPAILDQCFQQHILGADRRDNAVFITRDADNAPAGAELLGTNLQRPFRGMAPGSRKARGGFWIARRMPARSCLIVESAVDAISAYQLTCMQETDLFLSTTGLANTMPPWINAFQLQDIACGYDADPPGEQAAKRMLRQNPRIHRVRPCEEKDWNDLLRARQRNDRQNATPQTQAHRSPQPARNRSRPRTPTDRSVSCSETEKPGRNASFQ